MPLEWHWKAIGGVLTNMIHEKAASGIFERYSYRTMQLGGTESAKRSAGGS